MHPSSHTVALSSFAIAIIDSGATKVLLNDKKVKVGWTKEMIKYIDTNRLVYIQELGIHINVEKIKALVYNGQVLPINWNE